ncbi:MAG: hypothetical protein NE328_02740, partial [Lentisphaeraceae bacterium]|nr:hypothetical protein [Lentisphaeraceae bacterium]
MNKQVIINKYVSFPACILLSVLTACNEVKDTTQEHTNNETDKAVQTIAENSQKYEMELNKKFKKFHSKVTNKSSSAFDKAKESMKDANASLAEMTVAQKEDALEAVELSLDEIDEQIEAFEDWYDEKESTMSESTKKRYKDSLAILKKQKDVVEVWEEKLEESTPDTWDNVKKGFSNAYSSMANSWNNLFESDVKSTDKNEVAGNEQKYTYYTVTYFDPNDDSLTKNIAHYTIKEKEQAMEDIDQTLEALDEQIEDYAEWCSEHEDKVTASTFKKHQTTLVSMKTHRKSLQNYYEKLEESTPDTWDKIKMGFSDTYNNMTESLSK